MKLYIKQKVFSLKESYTVKDENGDDKYFVNGKLFSLGHNVSITDRDGNELARVTSKIFSFMPTFFIEIGSRTLQIKKKFTLFSQSFEIVGTSMSLDGNFFAHDFSLTDNSREIMSVYKEYFTWGDSYALDISDNADELLCLGIVVCVDLALHEKNN